MTHPKDALRDFSEQTTLEYNEPHSFVLVDDLIDSRFMPYHSIIVDFFKKRGIPVYFYIDECKGKLIGGGTDGRYIFLNLDTKEMVIGTAIHEWIHIIAKRDYHYIDEIYEIVCNTLEYHYFLMAEEVTIRKAYAQSLRPEEFLCKFFGLDGIFNGAELPCNIAAYFFFGKLYKDIPSPYQKIIDILDKSTPILKAYK